MQANPIPVGLPLALGRRGDTFAAVFRLLAVGCLRPEQGWLLLESHHGLESLTANGHLVADAGNVRPLKPLARRAVVQHVPKMVPAVVIW